MSEAELHVMRARFEEGRWNKAERGELGFNLPRGFLRRPSGEIILDPDERVRDTLRLVPPGGFDAKCDRCRLRLGRPGRGRQVLLEDLARGPVTEAAPRRVVEPVGEPAQAG